MAIGNSTFCFRQLAQDNNKETSQLRTTGVWVQEVFPSHGAITIHQGVVSLVYLGPSFS